MKTMLKVYRSPLGHYYFHNEDFLYKGKKKEKKKKKKSKEGLHT